MSSQLSFHQHNQPCHQGYSPCHSGFNVLSGSQFSLIANPDLHELQNPSDLTLAHLIPLPDALTMLSLLWSGSSPNSLPVGKMAFHASLKIFYSTPGDLSLCKGRDVVRKLAHCNKHQHPLMWDHEKGKSYVCFMKPFAGGVDFRCRVLGCLGPRKFPIFPLQMSCYVPSQFP